jgi:hypothetical protein
MSWRASKTVTRSYLSVAAAARRRRVGRVPDGERHPVGQPRCGRRLARRLDRGAVEVDPSDGCTWVRPRERQRRAPEATAEVEDPGCLTVAQPCVEVGHRGDPAGQLPVERGPVQGREAVSEVVAVPLEGHPGPRPVRELDVGERREHPDGEVREGAEERRAGRVEQHLGDRVGQGVDASFLGSSRIVASHQGPAMACCSSHSRANRASMAASRASSGGVIAPRSRSTW